MQAFKFARNVVATCVALLGIIGPASKATGQTSATGAVKTVLLIHGAWADGSSWSKLIPLLEAKGLHVVAVQIPLTSFADDVAATQRAIALEDVGRVGVEHKRDGKKALDPFWGRGNGQCCESSKPENSWGWA